ncbi:transmembrane protein 176B-like [Centropristis striata]|uniref:transmembrane protein 176B-like n=1 Tax=Centropristis striata TaxID=184440 RepID=UPI0027E1F40F|nr:transmembrane protein 176B-like [Centropristis striata]
MSVTMTRAEGVTVFTLSSDPQSVCPPLCQILKGLCYSPTCCSVSQHLRRVQGSSQSVLGAMHIMVGLLNIGLGVILLCSGVGPWWEIAYTGFPFWLGGLFILFGIMSIVSEKRPSPCLAIINVILNLAGVAFAIAAIALYSINLSNMWLWWSCERDNYDYGYYRHTTAASSPGEEYMKEKCFEGQELVLMLLRSMNAVLIVLSVLELCLVISSAVLGIKSLCGSEKGEKKETGDPELCSPLLKEVTNK